MVDPIMPSKWGPWSSMNHSDSAKKFFAEMMFHAAKQEPPKRRFLAFSHLRVRGVFLKNSRTEWIPHPRVKYHVSNCRLNMSLKSNSHVNASFRSSLQLQISLKLNH